MSVVGIGHQQMVLPGRDGWLFLTGDTNDVIGQQMGEVELERGERRSWRSLLRRRSALQRKLDFAWTMEIVPDKEAVYAEFLPPSVIPAPRRTVHQILDLADKAKAPVNYLLDDMLAAKSGGELFPKTDTHWNQRGAFAAYGSICNRLRARGIAVRVLDEGEVTWTDREGPQDLGIKLSPQQTSTVVHGEPANPKSKLILDNRISGHSRVMLFEQRAPELPTGILFGESFAMQMLGFLKESFRRLVFVHTSTLSAEIVAAERPDAVISLPIERFLIQTPHPDKNALQMLREVALAKCIREEVRYVEDEFTAELPHDQARIDSVITATVPWP